MKFDKSRNFGLEIAGLVSALFIVLIMAASVTAHMAMWGKPMKISTLSFVPWYSWLMLVVGTTMLIIRRNK